MRVGNLIRDKDKVPFTASSQFSTPSIMALIDWALEMNERLPSISEFRCSLRTLLYIWISLRNALQFISSSENKLYYCCSISMPHVYVIKKKNQNFFIFETIKSCFCAASWIVLYFMKWNKDFNYTKYLHSEEDLLTGHSVSQPLTIHPVLTINTLCLKMQSSHLQWRTQSPRS